MAKGKSNSSIRTPKFSVLKDLEYISVIKNKRSVLEIDGNDAKSLNNKTWREFQHYLGDKLSAGYYYYNLKQTTSPEIHSGTIRAVNKNPEVSLMENEKIENKINDLNEKLQAIINSKDNIGFDVLLESQKAGYEARIDYMKQQLLDKDIKIKELYKDIDDLEKEIDKLENKVTSTEKTAGWVSLFKQYEPLIQAGLAKAGVKAPTTKLASAPITGEHGIPDEIIGILAQVDYDELKKSPENYEKILQYLNMAVSSLPKRNTN